MYTSSVSGVVGGTCTKKVTATGRPVRRICPASSGAGCCGDVGAANCLIEAYCVSAGNRRRVMASTMICLLSGSSVAFANIFTSGVTVVASPES